MVQSNSGAWPKSRSGYPFDRPLQEAPGSSNTALGSQHWQHLVCPAMHSGVGNGKTAYTHHLFNVTQTQPIVQPKEHLAQGANNRTLTEIKHELDARF